MSESRKETWITEDDAWGFHETLRKMAMEIAGSGLPEGALDGPGTPEQKQEVTKQIYFLWLTVIGGPQRTNDSKVVLARVAKVVGNIYLDVFGKEGQDE